MGPLRGPGSEGSEGSACLWQAGSKGGGLPLGAMLIKSALRDWLSVSYGMISMLVIGSLHSPPPIRAAPDFPLCRQCYSVKRFTQAYVITTCAFFVCKKSLGLQKNIKTSKKGLTNPQKFEAPPVSKGTTPIVNKEDLL